MTAPTKADLAAENAQLREANEALQGLLTAIAESDVPMYCYLSERDRWLQAVQDRLQLVAILADVAGKGPHIIGGRTEELRARAAQPLPYTPACRKEVPGQTWTLRGHEYPDCCDLPLKHEGDCKSSRQVRAEEES